MPNYITQAQFMRQFNETHREEFNPEYFKRSNQEIMDSIKKVILSCEKDRYFTLKVLDMREIYSYEEIINLLKDHEDRHRKKNSKVENPYDYINIKDSDIMMLQVKYLIRHNGTEIQKINNVETVVKDPWEILEVLIVLPRFTRKYYFKLNGNYYSDIFQIVDGSTYNNSNNGGAKTKKAACNTFKTLFTPIKMYRMHKDLVDVNTKQIVRNAVYTVSIPIVYGNNISTIIYILACYGFYYTCDFLDIHCIDIDNKPKQDPDWFCFEKHGIFVSYPKICYNDPIIQSFAATILESVNNSTTVNDIYDIHHWLRFLGYKYKNDSIDKGLCILDAVDGVYDIITHDDLHLPEEHKADIYCIFRWMMREFNSIKNKNNVDVTTKRYRIAEPIATEYAKKLVSSLSRAMDDGKKVTLYKVKRAVYTTPMFVINKITTMSNLIAYKDMVNDNDGMTALKYTYKGVSGLGDAGTSIQKTYRYVDPSHAGILDLDSSTTSDPGMSGTICPLSKTFPGHSFSEYEEPNTWEEKFKIYQDQYFESISKDNVVKPVRFKKPPKVNMLESREKVIEESLDIDKVICPIRNVDPSIDYSSASCMKKEIDDEATKIKSLFTLKAEDYEDFFGETE